MPSWEELILRVKNIETMIALLEAADPMEDPVKAFRQVVLLKDTLEGWSQDAMRKDPQMKTNWHVAERKLSDRLAALESVVKRARAKLGRAPV